MSPETLQFFQWLLDQVNVPASAPDFDTTVATIQQARRELNEALNNEAKVDV
jgi:hypothetical protein